jgi:cytosine/adenosine deaminase-related metal-dependent hydrolase
MRVITARWPHPGKAGTIGAMSATTPGLVCGHHHLYSTLARGMPAPPEQPVDFVTILQQVWWRLDAALDLEMLRWSAMLGALEAVQCGTTAIIDHHEGPNAIEGSLDVIAEACEEVGVRALCAYGVTDRWQDTGRMWSDPTTPPPAMTAAARRGLDECTRFIKNGGRGMVGIHAAFTCSDDTLDAVAGTARDLGVGVHVHVAEGTVDATAGARLESLATDDWLLVHCVHLDRELRGRLAHNPRSNMNNAVGYARPAARNNTVILGTDGIGADMLEEFRLAYVAHRADDVTASPDDAWSWMTNGWELMPEAKSDIVTWNYDHVDSAWHVAFTPGVRALDVRRADGEVLLRDGVPQLVDAAEVRAKAAEQAARLFARL